MSDNTVQPVDPAKDDDGDGVVNNTELVGSQADLTDYDGSLPNSPVAPPDHAPINVDAPDLGMEQARNEANPTHDPALRAAQDRAADKVASDDPNARDDTVKVPGGESSFAGDPTFEGQAVRTPDDAVVPGQETRDAPETFRAKYHRNLNGTVDATYWPAGSWQGKSLGNFGDIVGARRAVEDAVATEFHRDRVARQQATVQEEAQARLDEEQTQKEEAYGVHIVEVDDDMATPTV